MNFYAEFEFLINILLKNNIFEIFALFDQIFPIQESIFEAEKYAQKYFFFIKK